MESEKEKGSTFFVPDKGFKENGVETKIVKGELSIVITMFMMDFYTKANEKDMESIFIKMARHIKGFGSKMRNPVMESFLSRIENNFQAYGATISLFLEINFRNKPKIQIKLRLDLNINKT